MFRRMWIFTSIPATRATLNDQRIKIWFSVAAVWQYHSRLVQDRRNRRPNR